MSIETSYGFRSAQAAYENANPFDGECTCEGDAFICDDCGEASDQSGQCPSLCPSRLRPMNMDEIADHFPSQTCPRHGWCTGCTSRQCEDCNG